MRSFGESKTSGIAMDTGPGPVSVSAAVSSTVEDLVRKEVPDWDDEVLARARFKAFSGQRSDWEPRYIFWRDLIVKIARGLGTVGIKPSEVKNSWFARGGLTPLCIDRVLLEMYKSGDIVLKEELADPTSGRLFQIIRRVRGLISHSRAFSLQEGFDGWLVVKALLEDKVADIVTKLSESNWNSYCIITMSKFHSLCKTSDEASIILSYMAECVKACYFVIRKPELIEGVKVSLVATPVPGISSLDSDSLHLISTAEKLQRQVDVIDQQCMSSRELAIAATTSRNKQMACRYIRKGKLLSDSRKKYTSLLERIEEVIVSINSAESTKKAFEAIQTGIQAIKENHIGIDEVEQTIQELTETIASQSEVTEALESSSLQSADLDYETIEEEFNKLAEELGDKKCRESETTKVEESVELDVQQSAKVLTQQLSNLNLEAA